MARHQNANIDPTDLDFSVLVTDDDQAEKKKTFAKRTVIVPRIFKADGKEDAETWLKHIDLVAKANKWTDEDILEQLPIFLGGSAYDYYTTIAESLQWTTWQEAREAIFKTFGPQHATSLNFEAMINRKMQPGESIRQYVFKKLELIAKCNAKATDDQKIGLIQVGLTGPYLSKTYGESYDDLNEFLETLYTHEEGLKMVQRSNNELQLTLMADQARQQPMVDSAKLWWS